MTTVSQVMTRNVRTMRPADTLVMAAQAMEELNVGVIPVCEGDKLMGVVTDRDIVVRGLARSLDAATTALSEVMSTDVRTTLEDADMDEVLAAMADNQIRRMPVVNAQGLLIGILSIGDIASKDPGNDGDVAASLGEISSPAEPVRS